VFTATTDLIVSSAPPERAGAASGISETGAELGGALGIAILGSIGIAVYRGQLAGALPADLPDQAAAAVQDTLGGAVGVAAQLPQQLGAVVLAAAREAFVQGLQLTAALSAAVAAATAVMATVLLRSVPAGTQAEQPAPAAEPAGQPASAAEPGPIILGEDAFQVIRSGSGCMACPGERRLEEVHGGDRRPHREGRTRS
jgi:DHA2 family multidrug resistance protein-like MFS transporter